MQIFGLKTQVILGEGSLSRLKKIVSSYDRVLLLVSRSMAREGFLKEAEDYISEAGAEVESIAGISAEPSYEYVEEILPRAREFQPELIAAIGGGSVIDVAKAVKVFYDAPGTAFDEIAFFSRFQKPKPIPRLKTHLVAIPSTSGAGSEVSGASVLKRDGVKYNIVSFEIAPNFAVLDPRLPVTMPAEVARNSGLDVLVHAIESYVSKAATPLSDAMAVKAAEAVFSWLPESVEGNEKARENMHYAATMAGIAFLNGRLGLCHAMSHKGAWMAPHGLLNAILHPYVMEFNMREEKARFRYRKLAKELGMKDEKELLEKVRELNEMLGVPALNEIVDEKKFLAKLDEMSKKAYHDPLINFNPVEPTVDEIKELYLEAYKGK